jgi:putative transposase
MRVKGCKRGAPSCGITRAPSSPAISFVVVTATFRVIYVFVVLEISTRRILHWNVTAHPTSDWTAQQFRMIVAGDQPHRFVIHDCDTIYSEGVDKTLAAMGLTVCKTPVRAPQANAFCERLVGTIRREYLDFMIPVNERHLRAVLRQWVPHYNRGRPHSSLGPGIPERPADDDAIGYASGQRLPHGYGVAATAILGGLHHEYCLQRQNPPPIGPETIGPTFVAESSFLRLEPDVLEYVLPQV